jgi:WD40 repeat protein
MLTRTGEEIAATRAEVKVDIAHEALITGWDHLQNWLQERREAEQTRRRLEGKSKEWVRLGRGKGGLLDQVELLEAERWLSSSDAIDLGYDDTLLELVQASHSAEKEEQQQKQRVNRFRLIALGVIGMLVVVAAMILYASIEQRRTNQILLRSSVVSNLGLQIPLLQAAQQSERAALLARQAYNFSQQGSPIGAYNGVDGALRVALNTPNLTHALLQGPAYSRIYALAFSPDGKTLAAGSSSERAIHMWNMEQPGTPPITLRGESGAIFSLAFSPDLQWVAWGDVGSQIYLENLRQKNQSPVLLRRHEARVEALAFSPDGRTLASSDENGVVILWDIVSGQPIDQPLEGGSNSVASLAFSPNGKMLATGGGFYDKTVRLWDLQQTNKTPNVLYSHDGYISALAFSPDGEFLASASHDRMIKLLSLNDPKSEPVLLRGHEHGVLSLAFSRSGELLASGSLDRTVRIWQVKRPGFPSTVLRGHNEGITAVAFDPKDSILVAGGDNNTVRLIDLQPTQLELGITPIILRAHQDEVSSVAFHPDGKTLISGGRDGTLRVWELNRLKAGPAIFSQDEQPVDWLAFSSDGNILASSHRGSELEAGIIRLWDFNHINATPRMIQHSSYVPHLALSPDGTHLALGGFEGIVD